MTERLDERPAASPVPVNETAAPLAVPARMPSRHMLRRLLGEHGPRANQDELGSFAAYLATGGALALDPVSRHPLER